jgi:hypothetical protein
VSEPAPPIEGALACPGCGATVDRHQEYCLECGLRLPHDVERHGRARQAARRSWAGSWLLPALLGLVVAIAGTAVAVALSDVGESEAAIPVATGGSLTATDAADTPTAPEPAAEPTTAPAPTAPARTTTKAPAAQPQKTLAWPRTKRGWTIVLLSLPHRSGRELAEERAAEARRRGLRNVGILNSSRFASLHPNYYVVFTGVFDSQAEAVSALQRAQAAFPSQKVYQREIVP